MTGTPNVGKLVGDQSPPVSRDMTMVVDPSPDLFASVEIHAKTISNGR
jgi:hypothetical protein